MKVKEFLNKLLDVGYNDYIVVRYAGTYAGNIRKIEKIGSDLILSNEFIYDGVNPEYDDIIEAAEDVDGNGEVIFNCPSMGNYKVLDVKRVHRNYSEDGDGEYDEIIIKCEEDTMPNPLLESRIFRKVLSQSLYR